MEEPIDHLVKVAQQYARYCSRELSLTGRMRKQELENQLVVAGVLQVMPSGAPNFLKEEIKWAFREELEDQVKK